MTGGVGFVSTGKDNDKRNRGFLRHTKSVKERGKEPRTGSPLRRLRFKKASKRDIARFMVKFRRQQRRLYIKQIILFIVVSSIVAYFLMKIMW